MSQLSKRLLELHYELLSKEEEEQLKVRIEQEPEVARLYEKVKQSSQLFSEAAKIKPTYPLSFSAPDAREEKQTISPPPERPGSITGSFISQPVFQKPAIAEKTRRILHSAAATSSRLHTSEVYSGENAEPDNELEKTFPYVAPRTFWRPFEERFSAKYRFSNRLLTVCSLLLLLFTCLGFLQLKYSRSLITQKMYHIQVAGPGVLTRDTQNLLSVDVSDIAGNPKQLPVRVSLLDDQGDPLVFYQEKTDPHGNLKLAIENPATLPESVYLEISAGEPTKEFKESSHALTESIPLQKVRQRFTVVDPPKTPDIAERVSQLELLARTLEESQTPEHQTQGQAHKNDGSVALESVPLDSMRSSEQSLSRPSKVAMLPHQSYAPAVSGKMQARRSAPASGQILDAKSEEEKRDIAGRPGMQGGMGGMGAMETGENLTVDEHHLSFLPAETPAEHSESEQPVLEQPLTEQAAAGQLRGKSQKRLKQSPNAEVLIEKENLNPSDPLRFQVRFDRAEYPLIASISQQGVPLAQVPLRTPQTPQTPVSVEIPENVSQNSGLLQISLYDPQTVPPQELANNAVFRRDKQYLKIEKLAIGKKSSSAVESAIIPPTELTISEKPSAIKITDENGMPVAAKVRLEIWSGGIGFSEPPAPSPILLDNASTIRSTLEYLSQQPQSFSTKLFRRLTFLGIITGICVSLLIGFLFFFKRVSSLAPLLTGVITGTICVLLGVAMIHDRQLSAFNNQIAKHYALAIPADTDSASERNLEKLNEKEESEDQDVLQQSESEIPSEQETRSQLLWKGFETTDLRGVCSVQYPSLNDFSPLFLKVEAVDEKNRFGYELWQLQ